MLSLHEKHALRRVSDAEQAVRRKLAFTLVAFVRTLTKDHGKIRARLETS